MSCAAKEHSDLFCNPEAEAYVSKLVNDYLEGERMSDTVPFGLAARTEKRKRR